MEKDADHFYRRAEEEIKRATEATCPEAVKLHYELADRYLDRVYSDADSESFIRADDSYVIHPRH